VKRALPALAALALSVLPAAARAETRRLAVLVASNAGGPLRPRLQFAEEDADRLASVLVELGSFDRRDLWVLKSASMATVRDALAEVTHRIAAWRDRPDRHAVVLFYYSGHSDGQALELGVDRVPFADVRQLLVVTAADVRLAILDSCRSGGLLAAKGGGPGPGFEVHLSDNLASAGEAFITSSAADESALESLELGDRSFPITWSRGCAGPRTPRATAR
jgi:caspase domain-containing protein